jgi:uncharacterized MAPEG superfamily protein
MTEPQLVAATGLLALVLVVPPLVALIRRSGLRTALGNREDSRPLPEWANRASRAQRNMVDTMVPFIAIVLAVQMAGASNENTQLGAALFFWGRAAHAVVYIAGVPYVRTLAFLISVNGMFRIAREVVPIASPSMLLSDLF